MVKEKKQATQGTWNPNIYGEACYNLKLKFPKQPAQGVQALTLKSPDLFPPHPPPTATKKQGHISTNK